MSVYDLVINNGLVVDTVSKTSTILNVGVTDGKIAAVTKETLCGNITIDAAGKYVCPGFIDVHGHIDGHFYSAKLSACQGITTTIGGNCGLSPLDIGRFFDEQTASGFLYPSGGVYRPFFYAASGRRPDRYVAEGKPGTDKKDGGACVSSP